MKQQVLRNWTLFRWLRLVVGLAIFGKAILDKDFVLGIAGLLVSGMAIFNIGSCASGSCYMPSKHVLPTKKNGSYEEVV